MAEGILNPMDDIWAQRNGLSRVNDAPTRLFERCPGSAKELIGFPAFNHSDYRPRAVIMWQRLAQATHRIRRTLGGANRRS